MNEEAKTTQDPKEEKTKQEPMVEEKPVEPYNPDEFDSGPDIVGKASNNDAPPNLVLDMSGTSDELPEFEPMPSGWYRFMITGMTYTLSSKKDPKIVIEYTCQDPNYVNRKVSLHTVIMRGTKPDNMGLQTLKRAMVRAQVQIDWAKFKPTEFCEEGKALGKMCDLFLIIGKPYRNKRTGKMTRSNNIRDFRVVGTDGEFMSDK